MKVLSIVGARPQFVKAAAVSRHLRADDRVVEVLVHTGQHYDQNMSDLFFRELGIPQPDYHLGIGSGNHGDQTGRMLAALEPIVMETRPDFMLVYGDTNSTLAGALVASKLHVRVAHVEAGLRSFNRRMPEEINRVVADHLSTLLFAPTDAAVANLEREGIAGRNVHIVGDVMYDVALMSEEKASLSAVLERIDLEPKAYVLATVHRAENTDDPALLSAIFDGLSNVAASGIRVIVPLHPRTRSALERAGLLARYATMLGLIEPLGYLDMMQLERHSRLIVTDSGGVQKEAFFQGVPCVTLRAETEWYELVEAGWNRLVHPSDADTVCSAVSKALAEPLPDRRPSLYGGGKAAQRIKDVLVASA